MSVPERDSRVEPWVVIQVPAIWCWVARQKNECLDMHNGLGHVGDSLAGESLRDIHESNIGVRAISVVARGYHGDCDESVTYHRSEFEQLAEVLLTNAEKEWAVFLDVLNCVQLLVKHAHVRLYIYVKNLYVCSQCPSDSRSPWT